MVTLPLKLNNMKITHEIREYIVEDNNIKYSVRHNILSDDWFYITPPKNPQIFSLWDERWLILTLI